MAGPWINNEVQRLVVSLGRSPGPGPKLDISVFLAAPALLAVWVVLRTVFPLPLLNSALSETTIFCAILGVLAFVFQLEYRPCSHQFGLSSKRLVSVRTAIWTAVAIGFTLIEMRVLWTLARFAASAAPGHSTVSIRFAMPTGVASTMDSVLSVFVGPALEELLFRGYFYLVLRQNWGHRPAALASSAVFALAHLPNLALAMLTFFMSLVYVYLDNRAGTLAPSIAAHALYNAVLTLAQSTLT